MLIAVEIKVSHTPQLQPDLSISLRVEFHHLEPIRCDAGYEGNEMLFRHG